MADDDDGIFDEIINNQPEDDDSEDDAELTTLWKAIEHLWPHFYPGLLLKGIILAEYEHPEDGRVLRFITSEQITPWEMLGMLESAQLDAREISQNCTEVEDRPSDDNDGEGPQ